MIVPTLPGSPTPWRYTREACAARAADPALAVDADHPGPGAQRADRVQQRRLDVLSRDQEQLGLDPGGRRGCHQVLALGHEQAAALALAPRARSCRIRFSFVVVGAGDQVFVRASPPTTKKGGSLSRAAREIVRLSLAF